MRIEADLNRRHLLGGVGALLGMYAGFGLTTVRATAPQEKRPLLLTNLRLFDGRTLRLGTDADILIDGDLIADLPPRGQGPVDAIRIDCGGRTAIPGLIDSHWHSILTSVTEQTALTADPALIHLMAAREAGATLQRGFTTVRDVGGPAFALKLAIDRGIFPGPRIFPAGAMISQTAGHGDFRFLHEVPRAGRDRLSHPEEAGISAIADGADAVLMRVREQLLKGASQIKMMAGGGVSSHFDPIDVTQYLERELRAGVEAAADWGTYVCVHVYGPEGIKRSVRAGVKSIEHGQLADEEAVRMMQGEGVFWSLQPFLIDEDSNPKTDPKQRADQGRVAQGTVRAYEWAAKHGVKSVWGTDILMNPKGPATQGRQLAKIARFYDPLTALRTATGSAGELLAMSGPRAPYEGQLGVVEKGALADLLVVDGAPEKSLDFLADPETNLRLIIKGGNIAKRTI
jgi:imidazolonepropionase-like amidohydrolase